MGNQQVNGAAGPPPGAGQRQPRGGGPHHHGAHHDAGPPGPQFGGGGGDPYGGAGGGGNKGAGGGYHHAMPPQQYNYQGAAGSGGGVMQQQQRTPSDVDMDMSGEGSSSSGGPTGGGASPSGQFRSGMDLASLSAADDDAVPTVFRWEHGGRQVYITGTFNGWSRQIPMHRSGNDFTYIHNLKRGKHAFKFIVDDEWRFAPDQPTVADIEGRINNFIDVTEFKAYTGDRDFEKERSAAEYGGYGGEGKEGGVEAAPGGAAEPGKDGGETKDPDGEVFSHTMPDLDEYTKEPPPLPPHLRHIILNKPPQLQDTAALPVPQHVALNHLYCTAIKDSMMVLGITQRYKTKFVTTVYYSPCKS